MPWQLESDADVEVEITLHKSQGWCTCPRRVSRTFGVTFGVHLRFVEREQSVQYKDTARLGCVES